LQKRRSNGTGSPPVIVVNASSRSRRVASHTSLHGFSGATRRDNVDNDVIEGSSAGDNDGGGGGSGSGGGGGGGGAFASSSRCVCVPE
jgi:hypothetical protein